MTYEHIQYLLRCASFKAFALLVVFVVRTSWNVLESLCSTSQQPVITSR